MKDQIDGIRIHIATSCMTLTIGGVTPIAAGAGETAAAVVRDSTATSMTGVSGQIIQGDAATCQDSMGTGSGGQTGETW